jgi:Cu2+-exporting ATPase
VTAVGVDTVIAEIQRSVERALADKPPLARLADLVAARFVGVVLATVAGVALFWWLQQPERWFEIALAVLIVSCPCALSLATPTAISATLGRMQALGMLVRRAAALEAANRLTHVVFDKTGTLTRGEPVLERVECAAGFERAACLQLAASLERHSQHPLARSLVRAAGDACEPALGTESVAGAGLRARIGDCEYFLGSKDFIDTSTAAEIPAQWLADIADEAISAVFLSTAERALAMFVFSDEPRDEARAVVAALRARGLEVVLMTGDRRAAAARVAQACGIDEFHAGLSPEDKMRAVQAMQNEGARVMMVGDGINDAPVLARADVSAAMGGATALARSSADIVLLSSRLEAIAQIFDIAARTRAVVRQNLAWALTYNFGAIPAAALGLVAPWLAALGMSLSSLVVVLNALRLSR